MPETNMRHTAQSVIPDDPEASAYRFIIVAAKRARQLQNGARSFSAHDLQETNRGRDGGSAAGLVQYDDPSYKAGQEALLNKE